MLIETSKWSPYMQSIQTCVTTGYRLYSPYRDTAPPPLMQLDAYECCHWQGRSPAPATTSNPDSKPWRAEDVSLDGSPLQRGQRRSVADATAQWRCDTLEVQQRPKWQTCSTRGWTGSTCLLYWHSHAGHAQPDWQHITAPPPNMPRLSK
jgi:hypothetical protein